MSQYKKVCCIGEDIFVVVASNATNWLPLFHLQETPFVELVSYHNTFSDLFIIGCKNSRKPCHVVESYRMHCLCVSVFYYLPFRSSLPQGPLEVVGSVLKIAMHCCSNFPESYDIYA